MSVHERVFGGALRAAVVALAAVPVIVATAGVRFDALRVLLLVAVWTFSVLLVERRDRSPWELLWRLPLASALAAALSAMVLLAVEFPGRPAEGLAAVAQALQGFGRGDLEVLLLLAPVPAAASGTFFWARTRTDRAQLLIPIACGWSLPLALLCPDPVAGLVGGAAAVVLPVAALLVCEALDPLPVRPPHADREGRELMMPALAGAALSVALFAPLAQVELRSGHRGCGNEAAAIGALKTIGTSQTLFREGDKDGDATLDYAGNLGELADQSLIDSVLGSGRKRGYTFRLVRGRATPEFLWAAAADPTVPGLTGDRYFATNHEGITYYTTRGPIPLDPDTCAIPPGVQLVGK